MNVLLLTESISSNATGSLVRAFAGRKHAVSIVKPADLYLFVSNHQSGFDRVYRDRKGIINRILSKDFDVVYPRIGNNLKFGAAISQHLQKNLGMFSPIPPEGLLTASDKFETIQKCSQFGIRTPRTIMYSGGGSIDQLISKVGGVSVVVKQIRGSQGKGVSILDTKRAIRSTLDSFQKAGIPVLIQEYIEAGGKDFRVFVVGGRVVATYQRVAPKGDFRANISGGGKGLRVEITKKEEFMCLLAAQAVGLPVAGVDFMRGKTGEPFLIEVNGNPGYHIEKVTGTSVSRAIVAFVEGEYLKQPKDRSQTGQVRRDTSNLMKDLSGQIKKVNRILNPVLKDKYLQKILTDHKGKTVDYTDRTGRKQRRELNSMTDLLRIMSETFKVK